MRLFLGTFLTLSLTFLTADSLRAEDKQAPKEQDLTTGITPVMVSLKDREAPSDEEWEALHKETVRGNLFNSLGNMKSDTVSFMDTKYFTTNSGEGTIASYGKTGSKGGYDRYGHVAGVSFDVPENSWKERYALNAAALVKLTGRARFAEFAGVELNTAVGDRRQIEVTFVGTMAPKDEVIRCLNADLAALQYLATLHVRHAQHKKKSGLFNGSVPPAPKVVLSNVMMLDARSSKVYDGSIGADATTVIHGIGGKLQFARQSGEEIALLTPVVRCYRTYSIEFRTDANGNLELATRVDRAGRRYQVPVVFDLTPDL